MSVINVPEPVGNGAPGKGWELSGCNNIILTQCTVRGCGQGFALGGFNNNIYFTNCDSYENADRYQGGDLCNGFNVHTGIGSHIYFDVAEHGKIVMMVMIVMAVKVIYILITVGHLKMVHGKAVMNLEMGPDLN